MMLCKLTDVKTLLNISAQDTSKDEVLTMLIKKVSAEFQSYIGYKLERKTYTEEIHSVNNRQLIQLNALPLRSVESVTINGKAITDYKIIPSYARWGRLYRGEGWTGNFYTQGFEHDLVSGEYSILVTYDAGYYLPNDTEHYTEDGDDSLPYDIRMACVKVVCMAWETMQNHADGLKAHSEGGISDTYGDFAQDIGISDSTKKALAGYVFYGVA